MVYGKCRLGGIRVPQRCFQIDESDDGRLEIVGASDPEQLAVVQLLEKMIIRYCSDKCKNQWYTD